MADSDEMAARCRTKRHDHWEGIAHMCGIAGIWGQIDEARVRRMMDVLIHRGPDASGLCIAAAAPGVVGHQRLSIIDPTGGNQPIYSADRTQAIIANGEIYNFPQLLPRLSQQYQFDTTSDSEAILHLYAEHELAAVNYLEGMYAFAIVDGARLVLARDPIGIKPLYYAEQDGVLLFASELKALANETIPNRGSTTLISLSCIIRTECHSCGIAPRISRRHLPPKGAPDARPSSSCGGLPTPRLSA